MSRFQQEISGKLGEYWEKNAILEAEKVKRDYIVGNLYVDENGVLRNSIGRAVSSEISEKCEYVGINFDHKATEEAYDREVSNLLAKYRERMKDYVPNEEERYELTAAFGKDTKVVNIITGKEIEL